VKYNPIFVLFILPLSNSPTGQTTYHIFMLNGSNDRLMQGCTFLALVDIAAHLRDQIAPKPQFWGRE